MWTTAAHGRDRQLRRELIISSVQRKARTAECRTGSEEGSAGPACDEGKAATGRIVITGWTGEPFVARPAGSCGVEAAKLVENCTVRPDSWRG